MKKMIRSRRSVIRTAVLFTIFGLIVEAFTIFWISSISFIIFAFFGLSSIGIGITLFLTTLIKVPKDSAEK